MTDERHIAVLTGKRGGYGAMKPMLREIESCPGMRLSLIVTDQHVNAKFGATIAEVRKEFNVAAAVDMKQADGTSLARSRALGVCLTRMTDVLAKLNPDILVLYGDRGEVLATALAAVTLRIPIAHLQGGDVSGNVDEVMRHAATKLSHLHFPSTEASARRILAMGEEPWRVRPVGDNHVDLIVAGEYSPPEVVRERYSISADERPIIVLYHPETTRVRDGFDDMRMLLDVVLAEKRRTIVVYPCSDHGYEGIVSAIQMVRDVPGVSMHQNIEAPDFWGILAISGVMVGNSSAGLVETPYFRIPAINVGDRQKGRACSNNVIHCNYDKDELSVGLKRALSDAAFSQVVAQCPQPFGDGFAYKRIVETLESVELGQRLLDKRMAY